MNFDSGITKFSVSLQGDETGKLYEGEFEARTVLSRRQVAAADAIRRRILGEFPESASPVVATDAFVAGQLFVRVTKAPEWFMSAGEGGIDLADRNILEDIFIKITDAEAARKEELFKKADKAKESLRAKLEKEE